VRVAVRAVLSTLEPGARVLVACSGGADSLALAEAVAFEAPKLAVAAGAVVVDHGLQDGSAAVAARAAAQCRRLGLDPVEVVAVQVEDGRAGPEAAARAARYAALEAAAERLGAELVLLGHTRDDQAEGVLLGLARGSGARSLSGMPARRGRYARPLLGLSRSQPAAAAAASGLRPWEDPHNADPAYARVRARSLLAALEAELGPGAEPGAFVGFAGARVIKDTTKQTLPPGFQTAEFLLKHGLVDQIVSRLELRDRIRDLLAALHLKKKPTAPADATA
jgi:tRNA(Ile)-lysidine synthase